MSVKKLLQNTNSTRSFTSKVVSNEDVKDILDTARLTSSGGNIQPWLVKCIKNQGTLDKITTTISEKILNKSDFEEDIVYYPTLWKKQYKYRRALTGKNFYEVSNINRKDELARTNAWIDNFKWFGGNTVLFIYVDKIFTESSTGMLIDIGMFIQNIIHRAEELGIDHCVQGSIGEYAISIKNILDIEDDKALLLSIVLGYKNNNIKNTYKPERISIEEFVTFDN
jgi:nitroreductase